MWCCSQVELVVIVWGRLAPTDVSARNMGDSLPDVGPGSIHLYPEKSCLPPIVLSSVSRILGRSLEVWHERELDLAVSFVNLAAR